MILAAVFLALASFGVALLRRGRFGRRLIALRDSEAAYAMLGGNLLLAKVAVFALAAGIAGLGGALYAMQQQSITSTQFSFEAGLPIFLLAVVGGLASVGSGLFAGSVLIAPINALIAVAPGLQNFTALLPGLAGIGLGRNPDGVVPCMRRDWAPVLRHRIALARRWPWSAPRCGCCAWPAWSTAGCCSGAWPSWRSLRATRPSRDDGTAAPSPGLRAARPRAVPRAVSQPDAAQTAGRIRRPSECRSNGGACGARGGPEDEEVLDRAVARG